MYKWRLRIFGILLPILFSQISHPMEHSSENPKFDVAALSILPIEVKELLVQHSVSNYVNQNFGLKDLKNLELNLYNLVTGFPEYLNQNLNWALVNREFYSISSVEDLDLYFKFFLTLKLSKLDIIERKNLLATIKIDKQCSDLIVVLIILSTLDTVLESFYKFKNAYYLMKQAIACRSIYFCRPIRPDGYFLADFYYEGIVNLDPAKFEDTQLLQIFIENQNQKENIDLIFDTYQIMFCLRSELKQELLSYAIKQSNFKEQYLKADLAKAIYSHDLDKTKELIESGHKLDKQGAENETTPLALAVIFEAKEIIEYLLGKESRDNCIDINNPKKKNALYYAATAKNSEILKLFLDRIKLLKISLLNVLKIAILTDNIELFNYAIDLESNPEFADELNINLDSVISIASKKNRVPMFQNLLKLDNQENCAYLCLSAAIENNCIDIAEFLFQSNNKMCTVYWIHSSPLPFHIARAGDLFKMKLLIDLGLFVGVTNADDLTPCMMAKERNYTEMVALLEKWEQSRNISAENNDNQKKKSRRPSLRKFTTKLKNKILGKK